FRADLFYRLQGIHVHLPALRNRQDRLPFAKMILKQVEKELHKQTLSFSTNAEQFIDRKSTRLNASHVSSSYAVFCLYIQSIPTTLRRRYAPSVPIRRRFPYTTLFRSHSELIYCTGYKGSTCIFPP